MLEALCDIPQEETESKDREKSKKIRKNKKILDKDLKELKLNFDNRLKVIKSLLSSTMYTKQYDVTLFVLKKYILDLKI